MTLYRSHSSVAKTMEGLADDISNLEAFLGKILLTHPHGEVQEGEVDVRKEADNARVEELQGRVVASARKLISEVTTDELDRALKVMDYGSAYVFPDGDSRPSVPMPRAGDYVIINGQRHLVTGRNTDLMAHHVRLEVRAV